MNEVRVGEFIQRQADATDEEWHRFLARLERSRDPTVYQRHWLRMQLRFARRVVMDDDRLVQLRIEAGERYFTRVREARPTTEHPPSGEVRELSVALARLRDEREQDAMRREAKRALDAELILQSKRAGWFAPPAPPSDEDEADEEAATELEALTTEAQTWYEPDDSIEECIRKTTERVHERGIDVARLLGLGL